MATQSKSNPAAQGPLHDVSMETMRSLDAIGKELELAEGDIAALEKLGMDVSRLKERVEWGKRAREIILERLKVRG
jgi:hypothetical protein